MSDVMKRLPEGLSKQRPVQEGKPETSRWAAAGSPPGEAGWGKAARQRRDVRNEIDGAQLETKVSAPNPRTAWDDLKEQATLAYTSGLLPRSIDSREKAITIALMGKELGLSPMQSLCGIYVVNGMTALRGSLMLRLIYERVPGARITVLTPPERASEECTVEMQRPHGKPLLFRYTLEDARKAGFMSKPIWQQHTATMLRWSAIRTGARVVFADAIAGCYMEDEIPGSEAKHVEIPEVQEQAVVTTTAAAPAEKEAATAEEAAPLASETSQPEASGPLAAASASVKLDAGKVEVPAPSREVAAKAYEPATPHFTQPRELVSNLPRARKVTEKQVNRLFAIARAGNWPRQEVTRRMEEWFKKTEPKELNWAEYDKLCNFLLEKPRKVSESSHSAANE